MPSQITKVTTTKQGWQHQQNRSTETVGQTEINTCIVPELNNKNINV